MSDNVSTTYEVDVIGRMWMPQCHGAMHYTIPAADLPEYARCDGETDLEYEARMVQCRVDVLAGDFSELVGYEITRCEEEVEVEVALDGSHDIGQARTIKRTTRYTTLQAFDDEQVCIFADCMSDGEGE